MSTFNNPFSSAARLSKRCVCGRHASSEEHQRAINAEAVDAPLHSDESHYRRVIESALMRAMFPEDHARRNFLKAVGASTAAAALATVLPIGTAVDAFAQGAAVEKKDL